MYQEQGREEREPPPPTSRRIRAHGWTDAAGCRGATVLARDRPSRPPLPKADLLSESLGRGKILFCMRHPTRHSVHAQEQGSGSKARAFKQQLRAREAVVPTEGPPPFFRARII